MRYWQQRDVTERLIADRQERAACRRALRAMLAEHSYSEVIAERKSLEDHWDDLAAFDRPGGRVLNA